MNNLSQNTRRWVSVLNASDETIPPYGVVSIVVDDVTFTAPNDDPKRRLVGKKYKLPVAADYLQNLIPEKERVYFRTFAVNSQFSVPAEKFGMMYLGDGPVWVRYEELDPAVFQSNDLDVSLGPHHDKWTVDTNGFGFVPLRKPDVERNRVLCRMVLPETPQLFLVSADFHQVVGQVGVDRYAASTPEYGPYARCRASPAHKSRDGVWRVDANEYVVECTQLPAIVCPPVDDVRADDDRVKLWCRWQNGKFWALSQGDTFFPRAKSVDGLAAGTPAKVLLDRDGAQPDYVVLADVPCETSVDAGSKIIVQYNGGRREFWVTVACCPEAT